LEMVPFWADIYCPGRWGETNWVPLCGSKYEIVCSILYKVLIKTHLQFVYSVVRPACLY
jgi:hypothetical protein